MTALRALGYLFAAAAILGVIFFVGLILLMAAFGIGATRSDLFGMAPAIYLLLIPPFAALLAYGRAKRVKRDQAK